MKRNARRQPFAAVISEPSQHSGCSGKRCYSDFPTADRMARSTNRNRDARTCAYRCQHCHRWHVGTKTVAERPRRR